MAEYKIWSCSTDRRGCSRINAVLEHVADDLSAAEIAAEDIAAEISAAGVSTHILVWVERNGKTVWSCLIEP